MRVLRTWYYAALVALITLHTTSNQNGVVAVDDALFPSAVVGLSDKSIEIFAPRTPVPSVRMRSTILPVWKDISPSGTSVFLSEVLKYWAKLQETDIQTFTGYYPNSAIQQKEAENKIVAYYDKAEKCLRRNDMRARKNFFEFNQIMALVKACLMDVAMPSFQKRVVEPIKKLAQTTMPGEVPIATQQPMIRPTETPTDEPTVAVMPTDFPSAVPVLVPSDDMPTTTPFNPNAIMQTGAPETQPPAASILTEAPVKPAPTAELVISIPPIEIPSAAVAPQEVTSDNHSAYLVNHVEEAVTPADETSMSQEPVIVSLLPDMYDNPLPATVAPDVESTEVNAPVLPGPPLDGSGQKVPLVQDSYFHPIVTLTPVVDKGTNAAISETTPDPESYEFIPSSSQVAPFWALDWDRSGLLTKDEWTLYSQHLAKATLNIINQTKDPIVKELLFSQAKYHYPRLDKCIRNKLIETRVNQINAEEFVSFRLWVQNYCFIKFRYSLLAGPPPFELVARKESYISSQFLTEWFNVEIVKAEKELQKDEISFSSLPYRQITALHRCGLEQFASAPETIEKEKFYQIIKASQECAEKKISA